VARGQRVKIPRVAERNRTNHFWQTAYASRTRAFRATFTVAVRYQSMIKREKCSHCDKDAIAYVEEGDGRRRYLCEDHMPQDDIDGDDPAAPTRQ
jgi:hypothetical protein